MLFVAVCILLNWMTENIRSYGFFSTEKKKMITLLLLLLLAKGQSGLFSIFPLNFVQNERKV